MNFDEKQFRSLADETYDKIISLGTTKGILIDERSVFVDRLVEFLKEHDTPFDVQLCLDWIDAMEHDPPCTLNSSYLHWIAFRRLVILIDKQSTGSLDHWTHYNSVSMPTPESKNYRCLVVEFRKHLEDKGYRKETARSYSSRAREFLIYLESKTGTPLELPIDVETQNAILDYILHERRECDSEYIFITAVGPVQKIQRHHIKFRRRAKGTAAFDKIPKDGLHILRRTGASRMLRSGVPLTTISSILGHVSENAVQRYLTTDEGNMRKCSIDLSQIPYSGRDL